MKTSTLDWNHPARLRIALVAARSRASHLHQRLLWRATRRHGVRCGRRGRRPNVPTALSGSVTLAQALNPNQANQVVTPLSFDYNVTPGGTSILLGPPPIFVFSTNNGVITDWYVSFIVGFGNADANVVSSSGGDSYQGGGGGNGCGLFHDCQSVTGTNVAAGVWGLPGDAPPPSLQAQVASLQK